MGMIYRLHLSFALLLLCILAITAVLIYPLLLDTLVDNQRKEMRDQASLLTNINPFMPTKPAPQKGAPITIWKDSSASFDVVLTSPREIEPEPQLYIYFSIDGIPLQGIRLGHNRKIIQRDLLALPYRNVG